MLAPLSIFKRIICIGALLATLGCSQHQKLTRETALPLLEQNIPGQLLLAVPIGKYETIKDEGLVDLLAERGILTKGELEAAGFVGNVTLTQVGASLVVKRGSRGVLPLGNRKLREITGIRETDETGRSAQVEFTWIWSPTEIGNRLDKTRVKRAFGQLKDIDFGKYFHKGTAECSIFDDGWRCTVSGLTPEEILNADWIL